MYDLVVPHTSYGLISFSSEAPKNVKTLRMSVRKRTPSPDPSLVNDPVRPQICLPLHPSDVLAMCQLPASQGRMPPARDRSRRPSMPTLRHRQV